MRYFKVWRTERGMFLYHKEIDEIDFSFIADLIADDVAIKSMIEDGIATTEEEIFEHERDFMGDDIGREWHRRWDLNMETIMIDAEGKGYYVTGENYYLCIRL